MPANEDMLWSLATTFNGQFHVANGKLIVSPLQPLRAGAKCELLCDAKPSIVTLAMILVDPALQRQGLGSEMLQHLCVAADGFEVSIHLQPIFAGADTNRLIAFYHRFHFEEPNLHRTMIRLPR